MCASPKLGFSQTHARRRTRFWDFAAMASFDDRKRAVLQGLATDARDKSRAGGVDAPIAALIHRINGHPLFFTTSSCSGRISVFSEPHPDDNDDVGKTTRKKKGGDWVYVSHETGVESQVLKSVKEYCEKMEEGLLVFRYEPFILALECRTPAAAQLLVACAVSAGFRESGITGLGKRNIVGVRCSIRLEVPIVQAGRMLVSDDYLRFLVALANKKMELNRQRTDAFLTNFIDRVEDQNIQTISELENCSPFPDHLPSEGGFEARPSDKISSIDKEIKRRLSALKGRQLRVLARLSFLENKRMFTISPQKEEPSSSHQGETRTFNPSKMAHKTRSEARPSAINGRAKSDGCSLPAAHLEVRGEPPQLHCWSHTTILTTEVNGHPSLLVYGGFGGPGRHARQGTSLFLDCLTCELKCLDTFHTGPPRMSHVAVVAGQSMVVIGGRHDPSTCLGDVCVLDLKTRAWRFLEVTGSHFLARHRHAAAKVGDNIYVFGGMNQTTVLGDFFVLNSASWEWQCISSGGDAPCPRYSHSLAAIGQKLYLFGGRDARRAYGDLHVFCLHTNTWTEQKGFGDLPPRFSHSMTAVGEKLLVILGGCPITRHGSDLLVLDVEGMVSKRIPLLQAPLDLLLVRHTATLVGTRLVVVGGGAACFAFGSKFNVPFSVDLEPLLGTNSSRTLTESATGVLDKGTSSANDKHSDGCEKGAWILRLDKRNAKVGKDALKQLGWLDRTKKPKVLAEGLNVAFPISETAASYLQKPGSKAMPSIRRLNPEVSQALISKLVAVGGEVVEIQLACGDAHRPIAPSVALEKEVTKLFQETGLSGALLDELPKRWERLGDMAILPAGSLTSNSWSSMGPRLWAVFASALGSRRIARQAPVAASKTRDSKLQLLYGESGWVEHRENGILYCFDATKCMFSSGNVSEKLRMASMKCVGETIVDLFAGIGYYTLPFLLKGGAKLVYACEWNPNAIGALRHNLLANGVQDRCIVLEGDNRLTAPKGVADRVCLGLLPSSEGSWGAAIEALRPEGGILHVHENVKDTSESQWLDYLVDALKTLSTAHDRHWEVTVVHLERVKWYAPHIRHLVADVQCSQIQ